MLLAVCQWDVANEQLGALHPSTVWVLQGNQSQKPPWPLFGPPPWCSLGQKFLLLFWPARVVHPENESTLVDNTFNLELSSCHPKMLKPHLYLKRWNGQKFQENKIHFVLTSSLIFSILLVTQLLLLCWSDGLLLWQLEQLILVTGRFESLASDIWLSSELVVWSDELVRWSSKVVRWSDGVVRWSSEVVSWSGQVVKAEILLLFLEGWDMCFSSVDFDEKWCCLEFMKFSDILTFAFISCSIDSAICLFSAMHLFVAKSVTMKVLRRLRSFFSLQERSYFSLQFSVHFLETSKVSSYLLSFASSFISFPLIRRPPPVSS